MPLKHAAVPFPSFYGLLGHVSSRFECPRFNIAVLLTNQVCADPGGATFVQDAKKARTEQVMMPRSSCQSPLRSESVLRLEALAVS